MRLQAESYGYLPTEVELQIEEHDPYRTEVAAVQTREIVTEQAWTVPRGRPSAASRSVTSSTEIDLADQNWNALCELLGPFHLGRPDPVAARPACPRRYGGLKAARAWARANGYAVSDTGPLPHSVQDAFLRAQR